MRNIFKKVQLLASINGYTNVAGFLVKYLIPLCVTVLVSGIAMIYIVPSMKMVAYVFLIFGFAAVLGYPISVAEKKKRDINNNIHLFITYAGTLSTMKVSRGLLFKRISQRKVFGEISEISQRILYLSKKWNLGFAKTCRKLAKVIPSTILSDFFDRFAVMMDFGEELESFFASEQVAVLDDYATEYKKSLETIKTLQDVFISLSMAISFGIAIGLLVPLLMGVSITYVITIAIVAILLIDGFMIILVKAVIPDDPLFHKLELKSKGIKRLEMMTVILAPLSFVFILFLWLVIGWNFFFSVALGVTPLFVIGLKGKSEEEYIYRRDMTFPTFVRTLGSATEIRSGALIASLGSMRIHDFALLNDMVINLYKRLKIGSEKYKCWYYFAAESGSNLIFHFSRIFAESVYLGGNAKKIGQIIDQNFQRLLSLRKLKVQQAAGLRGASYGSLIGLAATTFVSLEIVELLANIFDTTNSSSDFSVGNILGATTNLAVEMASISLIIGLMIILHAIMSSILLKIVDGGTMYAIFFDIVIMVWIGALMSWVVPTTVGGVLPDLSNNITSTPVP